MATFEAAVRTVLEHEGGYVCDPDDPGGETNLGICKRWYPGEDIPRMTVGRAMELYRRDYWDPLLDKLPIQALATKILDLCVNLGKSAGLRLVQAALNDCKGNHVTVDGVLGPNTLQALKLTECGALLRAIRARQVQHYLALVRQQPRWEKYLDGWIRRAVS